MFLMHVTSDLTSGNGTEPEPRLLLQSGQSAMGLWDHFDAELESRWIEA